MSNNKTPIVSVIIPAYNAKRFIEETIESVLIQDVDSEIIVVDDCSKDNLEEHLKNSPYWDKIVYSRNEKNLGVAETRNRGVRLAKGEYVAYLDSDDYWRKGKLREQLSMMKNSGCVLSYTARELVSESGESLQKVIPVHPLCTYASLSYHNEIPCSSIVMKREVALSYPMRRSDLHEDYLHWLEILKEHKKAIGINTPYLVSRMTAGGKSRNKIKSIPMTYGVHREMGRGVISSSYYTITHLIKAMLVYS